MSDQSASPFANRDAVAGVMDLLVERWSPRAFAKTEVDADTLTRIFDAARWSPSCFNEQPWRFYTSTSSTFSDFLMLLNETNQTWAQHASVIGFLTGKTHFSHNDKPNNSFAFDCGAAWMAMTLQARTEGLYTHGMAGILYPKVAEYLALDTREEQVLMGFAIGKMGDKTKLPEAMQAKEAPSARKPLADIWVAK